MNHHSRVNPFEIALWVLGAVLIVGGIASSAWAIGRLGGGGPNSAGFVATQLIYTVAPAAVTAGLVAIVAALAFRAALLVVARRAASTAQDAPFAETSPTNTTVQAPGPASSAESALREAPLSFDPPRFRQRQRATDHSAFKRPGAE